MTKQPHLSIAQAMIAVRQARLLLSLDGVDTGRLGLCLDDIQDALADLRVALEPPAPYPAPISREALVRKIRAYHMEGIGPDEPYVVFDLSDEEAEALIASHGPTGA